VNRRDFLEQIAKSVLLMAAAPLISRCSANQGATSAAGTTYTSLSDGTRHQHTFLLPNTAVQAPGAGYTGNTSTSLADGGHYHTITLTSNDLSNIAAGSVVNKATSTSAAHSHNFSL